MAESKEAAKHEAKERPSEKKGKGGITWEHVALIFVFVAILVAAAYFTRSVLPSTHNVYGLKVVSAGDPEEAMKFALAKPSLLIELRVFDNHNATDSRNGALSLMAGTVAQAVGESGKKAAVYGKYADKDGFVPGSCSKETNFCSNPDIVVEISGCNCLRVQNGRLQILYDEASMKNQTLLYAIGGVVGGVARKT